MKENLSILSTPTEDGPSWGGSCQRSFSKQQERKKEIKKERKKEGNNEQEESEERTLCG